MAKKAHYFDAEIDGINNKGLAGKYRVKINVRPSRKKKTTERTIKRYTIYFTAQVRGKQITYFPNIYLANIPNAKRENKLAIKKALELREQFEQEYLNAPDFFTFRPDKQSFFKFAESLIDDSQSFQTQKQRKQFLKLMKEFYGDETLTFSTAKQLQFAEGFYNFLLKRFPSISSANVYLSLYFSTLNRAKRERIVSDVPYIKRKKPIRKMPVFLTPSEYNLLVKTPCRYPYVKAAFLFACNTGLRYSDVRNLRWDDINNGYLHLTMIKTRREIFVPLNPFALSILSSLPKGDSPLVFNPLLPSAVATIETTLRKWAKTAGVKKHLTFHVSRHTFVSFLKNQVGLSVVSELVGHTKESMTATYGGIFEETKQKAVLSVPGAESAFNLN